MSSLPEEVYFEILLRVPVRFAYACKCVCKSWFEIISDPSFDKLHLNLASQKNNPNPMLARYDSSRCTDLLCSISYDSVILDGLGDDVVHTVVEMEYPFKSSDYVVQLVGSCNGMVCLISHHGNGTELFCVIWNPATKEQKKVIKLQKALDLGHCGFTFAYDRKTDDYKLAIMDTSLSAAVSLIHVYTVGSNSLKSFGDACYWFSSGRHGVLFNGILHWLGGVRSHWYYEVIIAFDMCEKRFEEIKLPVNNFTSMSVGIFEGCLCTIANAKAFIDVWVMQEYGVRETWNKRYSITHERIMNSSKLSLVYSFKNGHMLFSADLCKLLSYDPKDANVRELNIQNCSIYGDEEIYCNS